jgi:hypothetical protein
VNIEGQITAALDGRREQIPFVEGLSARWDGLASHVSALSVAATDLAREAGATRAPTTEHAALFRDLTGYLAPGGDWQQRAAVLSGRLTESAAKIGVLHRRVTRKTVNIGVVGTTGAGKSTLLRKLSGLGEKQIPSNTYESSTATPSRIFHKSGPGDGSAILHLHTRESFLAEVIAPLHEKAKLAAPPPLTIEEFRRFGYPRDPANNRDAGPERFILRLIVAQESLPSYEHLLRGGELEVGLDDLRPFVAYPESKASRDRQYHAVRSADIFCPFPQIGVVSLGLVDLPGSGEAALDVHRRFLDQLRNETDLLFIVKRPTTERGEEQDWEINALAQDAAAGVRREDFAHLVINRDARLESNEFEYRAEQAAKTASHLGSSVLTCDILQTSPDEVTQRILAPTLEHIARRLRDMDRDAIAFVLADLADIAAQARSLASDLAQHIEKWQGYLQDEEVQYRKRIRELLGKISRGLDKVTAEYDELYNSGETLVELTQEISRAEQAMADWQAGGLGDGSTEHWLDTFYEAITARREGHERDRRYNATRNEIVKEFGQIDNSLKYAINRLWSEVAAALRATLTTAIIPDERDGKAALEAFRSQANSAPKPARAIGKAVEDLLGLQEDYGSLFLRVGRPVVRRIWWGWDLSPGAATAGSPQPPPAAAPAGEQDDGLDWMEDDDLAPLASSPFTPAAGPAPAGPARAASADPLATKYPAVVWQEHVKLCQHVESVSGELRELFLAEAERMMVVLAASVEKFKDGLVTGPDIDIEWERLCRPAQGSIWKDELATAAAGVTTAMAALHQDAAVTATTADDVSDRLRQARRL